MKHKGKINLIHLILLSIINFILTIFLKMFSFGLGKASGAMNNTETFTYTKTNQSEKDKV